MSDQRVDRRKRRLLVTATGVMGGIVTAAAAAPFVASMFPSERAKAAGAPVEADISKLAPGALQVVEWRGKPVWIMRRTPDMLKDIKVDDPAVSDPASDASQQPAYAKNEFRSIKPEILVLVGVCTHLGCSPQFKPADDKAEMGPAWAGGFYCPCHGSKFDLAGRVLKGSPAPINLVVPPYQFVGDDLLVIGTDAKRA